MATYSGMLPGTLAGQYSATDMQIDLSQFCSDSNARLIQKDITGVDVQQRQLLFSDRSPLRFDALSIGVGSRPSPVPGDDSIVVRV
ncbi:MAG: bifunctional NADH dehydrogenase FAD-containing subunit/selenide, water dikinase SelD, partial [Planctomycetota bacterium]